MSRFAYDYYTVEVPADNYLCDIFSFEELAISQAEERVKLFCIPAEWSAEIISNEEDKIKCKVRRKRNKK